MVKKTIVMLSGKAGAGKDTFAEMLGSNWERVAFADELKRECSEDYDIPLEMFHDRLLKDKPIGIGGNILTPRDLLIRVGMEHRELNPNHWVDKVTERIRESTSEFFVITDWRFPNELESIREAFLPDLSGYNAECKALADERDAMDAEELGLDWRSYPTKPKGIADIYSVRIVGSGDNGSSDESECALDNSDFAYTIINRDSKKRLQEKALVLGCICGEEDSAEEIYDVLKNVARRTCSKYVFYSFDRSVVSHDATLYTMRLLRDRFDFTCLVTTFAYSVVYYYCQNYRREWGARNKHICLGLDSYDNVVMMGRKNSPLIDGLLSARIQAAIATLPSKQRRLISLRFEYGYTHKEIAVDLGVSENYSRRLLCLARGKLQVLLKDEYLELL